MKERIAQLFLLLLPFLTTPCAYAVQWEHVYKANVESVPFVISANGICAGALVDSDLVVTAWHCVGKMRPIVVGWKSTSEIDRDAQIIHFDKKNDLALLRLSRKIPQRPFPLLPQDFKLEPGLPIAAIGHPLSLGSLEKRETSEENFLRSFATYTFSVGIVSRVGQGFVISDVAVEPGNSGGPVLNEKGQLVGIVSAVSSLFMRFTPADKIRALVEETKRKGETTYPSVWDADDDFHLGMFVGWDEVLRKSAGTEAKFFIVDVAYDMADRIRLGYRESFFRPEKLRGVQLGYVFSKHFFDFFEMRLVPMIGRNFYDLRSHKSDYNKLGMLISLENALQFEFEFVADPKPVMSTLVGISF